MPSTPEPVSRKRGRPRKEDIAAQLGTKVSQLPDGPSDAEGLTARQRRILEVIRDALVDRGYPAFLVPPESPSVPQIYRVRVGGYDDPREAEQVSSRIAKEERFKPLVRPR